MKYLFLSFFIIAFLSCGTVNTVDVESASQSPGAASIIAERERVLFIPEKDAEKIPPSGTAAVRESNNTGIIKPQDYSHAAMIYDYHPDRVFEIFAQPLRVCDILLEPGEQAVEAPFIADSERWLLGAGVSYENGNAIQHIYVKPTVANIEASLIINTDRRVYHVIMRSFQNVHMPIVRWRYFTGGVMPNNYMASPVPGSPGNEPLPADIPVLDPRFLSFDYRIKYGLRRPVWLPELVFDDGAKTYITFPASVLQRDLPGVFENRKDILNYRVSGNIIIIDKLIENITVKINRKDITIEKKKG